jgi:1,4-dihydroxy-2-naphthoyl-CoA synthase
MGRIEDVMTFENVLFEKKNGIGYVTVNRPKALNALNMATMGELRAAFTDIQQDAAVRSAILTGAGEKAFVAGADINELAQQDAVSGKAFAMRGQSVLDLIENLGKPVIACINGFALGGGCELALHDAAGQREREAGTAGSETGDSPRVWGVAAVAEAGGERDCDAGGADWGDDFGSGGDADWVGE